MNHQMPLTHPLIFCDHWQSGTTLGKREEREWVEGNDKKKVWIIDGFQIPSN